MNYVAWRSGDRGNASEIVHFRFQPGAAFGQVWLMAPWNTQLVTLKYTNKGKLGSDGQIWSRTCSGFT